MSESEYEALYNYYVKNPMPDAYEPGIGETIPATIGVLVKNGRIKEAYELAAQYGYDYELAKQMIG
jgi:DNA polymerase/3'-5' exonuclease PolX